MPAPPRWWPPLAEHLASRYPLVEREADWLLLGWPEQTVQVKLLVIRGRARVVFVADICGAELVSPADALELGAKILLGGVVTHKGLLSLRHFFAEDPEEAPPADLVSHPRIVRLLDETITTLRDDAARMRRILLRRQSARKKALSDLF